MLILHRAFASEEHEEGRYQKALKIFESKSAGMGHFIAIFQGNWYYFLYLHFFKGLSDLYLQGFLLCVLLYGRSLVNSGELTGGALGSFLLYTMNLQRSMTTLSILQGEIVKGMTAARRILDVINTPATIPITVKTSKETFTAIILEY